MYSCIDPSVLDFLADPEREIKKPYARSAEFLLKYLRHCANRITSSPGEGRDLVLLALRVIAPQINVDTCTTVQIWSLFSAADRFMGRLDKADAILDLAFDLADECLNCQAHLLRKRALVRVDQKRYDEAIAAAGSSIEIYRNIETDDVHEILGDGHARAFLWRGNAYYEASESGYGDEEHLISCSATDYGRALALLSPQRSPKLYGVAIFNLGAALAATGKKEDLLTADQHVRKTRGLFRGIEKISQERAKLDWLTAMIRHELRTMRPARVRFYLSRSLNAFVVLGMPQETVAVAADLARIAFPDQNRIRTIVGELEDRLCRISDDLRQKIQDVQAATRLEGWDAAETVKAAIEALREACGPKTLPCLIAWPSNS